MSVSYINKITTPDGIEYSLQALSFANNFIIKINSGTTEGTNLYTFDGTGSKTLDIKSSSNITFTPAAGSLTISASDQKVKQTPTTGNSAYELLFSGTADNTERTEGARKTSTLTYNPSTNALIVGTTSSYGTINGYTLAAAAGSGVASSISTGDTSTALPTAAAVASFIDGLGYTTSSGVTSITPGNGLITGTTGTSQTPITTTGTISVNFGSSAAAVSSSAAAGSANTVSRSDHVHNIVVSTGDSNGQIKIAGQNVSVKGLGSNAYTSTAYAPLASPDLTGTPTAPTATSGTNTTQIATTAFVQSEIVSKLAANDAMIFKGTIGTGGTVTALPTTHNAGWTYRVITAGTYANVVCEVGDLIICITDGTAANDAHWTVAQTNIDGAVVGPSSATNGAIAVFNGTSGKLIKSTSITFGSSTTQWLNNAGNWTTPSDTKVTNVDNHYAPSANNDSQLSASAASGTAAWDLNVVTGVQLQRDAKGHVTGVTVSSGKIPSNPGDTKVKQSPNTDNKEYSILLKNSDNTTEETTTVKFGATTSKLATVNPSTGIISAAGFYGSLRSNDVKTALGVNSSDTTATFLHKSGSWKTISVTTTANTSGAVLTNVTQSSGTLPSLTGGTPMTATVNETGTLILTAGQAVSFSSGSFPTLTLTKANLNVVTS